MEWNKKKPPMLHCCTVNKFYTDHHTSIFCTSYFNYFKRLLQPWTQGLHFKWLSRSLKTCTSFYNKLITAKSIKVTPHQTFYSNTHFTLSITNHLYTHHFIQLPPKTQMFHGDEDDDGMRRRVDKHQWGHMRSQCIHINIMGEDLGSWDDSWLVIKSC